MFLFFYFISALCFSIGLVWTEIFCQKLPFGQSSFYKRIERKKKIRLCVAKAKLSTVALSISTFETFRP